MSPKTPRVQLSKSDQWLSSLDHSLRSVFAETRARRPSPAAGIPRPVLTAPEQREAAALMRVNHVGEICAQALYQSQALTTRNPALQAHFVQAAQEEADHLAWTAQRVAELGSHLSLLNPVWYTGAFAIGSLAGVAGDRWSLGFVVETERQVEQHLASHLDRLPAADQASRAIVTQMQADEARHADEASAAGGRALPAPVRGLMRLAAQVMTRTAHYV